MEATCVAWEPTSPEANRYMLLNVQYLGWAKPHVAGVRVGCELAMMVSATPARGSEPEQFSVWRIVFHGASAYRCTSADRWRGPCPWWNDDSNTAATDVAWKVATWEIVDSHWIPEAVSRNASVHDRHFVVASSYEFVDVAALKWEAQEVTGTFGQQWPVLEERLHTHWASLFA